MAVWLKKLFMPFVLHWTKFYFLSSRRIIQIGPPTPPFPINGRGSPRNTQYTLPTHHTRHSNYLYYILRVSNVSSPTNEYLYVSMLVRVASAFDIRRHLMGGGTPNKKMEKRHFWCTPVPHPVQKRYEPSKTSIGVHRLWFFYPAEKKFHFEFFFEMYRKNVEKYNINRGYSVMKNNFLADKNALTVISIRFLPLSEV